MWFWILIISFSSNGPFYDEIDYPITPDNYQEYQSMIPNRIYNSFRLAVAEPSILQPCDSTVWYLGDSMVVSWQGGALFGRAFHSQLIDSVHVTLPQPEWSYVMELYQNGDYIETLSPTSGNIPSEPFTIESLESRHRSYILNSYPLDDVGEFMRNSTSGSGFQIRMLIWSYTDSMRIDRDKYIELWSEHFRIDDPWLEVVAPNASTIWREDSSDVYVEFISHGLFGYDSPESISPSILLIKGNEEIRPSHISRSYTQGALDNNAIVDRGWGNGSGFRVCLVMGGERFFSDYFHIFGQTIQILQPSNYWIVTDSLVKIEWCSSVASEALINLDDLEIELFSSSGETVSIELYGVDQTNLSSYFLATLAYDVQNDGLFLYVNFPNEDWIDEYVQLKIVDCDGNYGWSEVLSIRQF